MPEQYPLPGMAFGQRWVSTPACRAARAVDGALLAPVHYVTLYLMTEPVEATLDEFAALGGPPPGAGPLPPAPPGPALGSLRGGLRGRRPPRPHLGRGRPLPAQSAAPTSWSRTSPPTGSTLRAPPHEHRPPRASRGGRRLALRLRPRAPAGLAAGPPPGHRLLPRLPIPSPSPRRSARSSPAGGQRTRHGHPRRSAGDGRPLALGLVRQARRLSLTPPVRWAGSGSRSRPRAGAG